MVIACCEQVMCAIFGMHATLQVATPSCLFATLSLDVYYWDYCVAQKCFWTNHQYVNVYYIIMFVPLIKYIFSEKDPAHVPFELEFSDRLLSPYASTDGERIKRLVLIHTCPSIIHHCLFHRKLARVH